MAELKTRATSASVTEFLNGIADRQKRADCKAVARMMRAATGKRAKMWGSSIIGYGRYDYRHANGKKNSFFLSGFSPRARNISIYIMPGFEPFNPLMRRLGKYKTGKSCLYINSLSDVDSDVLQTLIESSVEYMRDRYSTD